MTTCSKNSWTPTAWWPSLRRACSRLDFSRVETTFWPYLAGYECVMCPDVKWYASLSCMYHEPSLYVEVLRYSLRAVGECNGLLSSLRALQKWGYVANSATSSVRQSVRQTHSTSCSQRSTGSVKRYYSLQRTSCPADLLDASSREQPTSEPAAEGAGKGRGVQYT